MEIQKRRSNKHKKGCDWGYWDYIWDNCGVPTLKKGIEEECEEITMENSGQIVGQEGERKGENILAQHRQNRCQKQIKGKKTTKEYFLQKKAVLQSKFNSGNIFQVIKT